MKETLTLVERLFELLLRGDIGTDRDVLLGPPLLRADRHDGRGDPEVRPVTCTVADLAVPHTSRLDGVPELAEELLGMEAGVDDVVIDAHQFVARVTADVHKPVVGIHDPAVTIGNTDDRVFIECCLLLFQGALHRLAVLYQIGHQPGQPLQTRGSRGYRIAPQACQELVGRRSQAFDRLRLLGRLCA